MQRETHFLTNSAAETERLGEVLARGLGPGDTVACIGDLGAGKTCLVRGIARGLGSDARVTSPTFVLAHTYPVANNEHICALHHLDLYRLAGCAELEDIGGVELLYGDDVCVVEWAERVSELLPPTAVWVRFEFGGNDSRRIRIASNETRLASLEQGAAELRDHRR